MKFDADAEFEDDERRASQAVHHVASAHHLLTLLRDKLGVSEKHPELGEAITKLEIALSVLTINTGGML